MFVHRDILDYLEGLNFSFFSFSFLDLSNLPVMKQFLKVFSEIQSSYYMNKLGLRYVSTYRNISWFILYLTLVAVIHVVVILPFYWMSQKYEKDHKFKVWMQNIYLLFTFTMYIRLILESYLLISLSSINELWVTGANATLVVLILVLVFTGSIFIALKLSVHPSFDPKTSKIKELFSGIKNTLAARFYF